MTKPLRSALSAQRSPSAPPRAVKAAAPAGRKVRRCDYTAPASLFVRESTRLRYQSFDSAAEAVRYANEELDSHRLRSCTLDVGNASFAGHEVRELYLAEGFPLERASNALTD